MPHIDPRREHDRALMIDRARASVSGRRINGRAYRTSKRIRSQKRRNLLNAPFKHQRGFRCSASDDCSCIACATDNLEIPVIGNKEIRMWLRNPFYPVDDLKPGLCFADKMLAEFEGDHDACYHWIRARMPDTLAGRHMMTHIREHLWWRTGS